MDSLIEACLLRALLEEPWGESMGRDGDARQYHVDQLEALAAFEFSDAGIKQYALGLDPDERFSTIEAWRAFIDKEKIRLLAWVAEKRREAF